MSDNHIDNSEEKIFFPERGKVNPFVVPDGYFETLSDRILAKIELQEEIREFNLLSQIKKQQTFSTPADYFKAGEEVSETSHELAAYEHLRKINKPGIKYTALENEYFLTSTKKIEERIEVVDELKAYDLLYAVDKKNNFAIEPDYFETLADRIKERKSTERVPKVSFFEHFLTYILKPKMAVSFIIILVVGIGLLMNKKTDSSLPAESGDCKTLACLEKRELLNEHTIRELDDDNLYDMVDVDALNTQLSKDSVKTDSATIKNINGIKNK